MLIRVMAKRMVDSMINEGFCNVDELWGTEVGLIAQGLYAGTSDAIGLHNGTQLLILRQQRNLKNVNGLKTIHARMCIRTCTQ